MGTLPSPWDVETAARRIQDLVPYHPSWVEEPLMPENFSGYQELSKKKDIPIAMGESFTGLHEFEAYLTGNCVDFIQPDVTHCGGFSQAIKVIALAKKYKIPVALHVWGSAISLAANLHLALAMPEVEWLEIPQVRLELLADESSGKINIENGFVSAINEPGLGLNISEKIKSKFAFVPGSGYRIPSQN
jgi:L-alanine-DL-glutamate epimerase-like enolase superfamily enzyme